MADGQLSNVNQPSDYVFQIERKYPEAKDVEVNGIRMWPFLRIMFRYMIVDKLTAKNGTTTILTNSSREKRSLWQKFKAKFGDNLFLWFRKYDVVIFSNELEKKKIGSDIIDKLSESIVDKMGKNHTLTIDYFPTERYGINEMRNKNSVNGYVFFWFSEKFYNWKKIKISAEHKRILENILNDFNLEWNGLELRIRIMLMKMKLIKYALKILKPKAVITSCYSYFPEIYAAKSSGIRTIELQHGIISPAHPGYESLYPLNKDFTANHLFIFGSNSISNLSSNLVNPGEATVIGNYYLEVLGNAPFNEEVLELTRGYKKSVCVPTDYLTEKDILDFIITIADQCSDTIFLVVPRSGISEQGVKAIEKFKNLVVVNNLPFQEVVRHCTYHTATNSSCCLEALTLGTPNILINLHNKAYELFGNIVDPRYTKFVTTAGEYLQVLYEPVSFEKSSVKASNERNFASGYFKNLTAALERVGLN